LRETPILAIILAAATCSTKHMLTYDFVTLLKLSVQKYAFSDRLPVPCAVMPVILDKKCTLYCGASVSKHKIPNISFDLAHKSSQVVSRIDQSKSDIEPEISEN